MRMSARYLASCCGPQAMSYRRVALSSPSSPCAGLRAHGRQCRVVRNRLDRWGGAAEAHHSRRPSPGSPHHLTRTWFAQSGAVRLSRSHSNVRVSCPRRAAWCIAQGSASVECGTGGDGRAHLRARRAAASRSPCFANDVAGGGKRGITGEPLRHLIPRAKYIHMLQWRPLVCTHHPQEARAAAGL